MLYILKPKAAVLPPTRFLKAIFKLPESGTARDFSLVSQGRGLHN